MPSTISQALMDLLRDLGHDVWPQDSRIGVHSKINDSFAFFPINLTANQVRETISTLAGKLGDPKLLNADLTSPPTPKQKEPPREEKAITTTITPAEPVIEVSPATEPAPDEAKPVEVEPVTPQRVTVETDDAMAQAALDELYAAAVQVGPYKVAFRTVDATFSSRLLGLNRFWQPVRTAHDTEVYVRSNRPITYGHVDFLANEMVPPEGGESRWKTTHQAGAFDINRKVHDCQHRLLALLQADSRQPGYSMDMYFFLDVDPDTFDVTDVGRVRSMSDILGLDGEKDRNLLGGALRLLKVIEKPSRKTQRIGGHEQRLFLLAHPNVREAVRLGRLMCNARNHLLSSSATAALYLLREACPDGPWDSFVEGVRTGANLADGDPRLALINWGNKSIAPRNRDRRRDRDNLYQTGVIIVAANRYAQGVSIKDVRYDPAKSEFPKPIVRFNPTAFEAAAWQPRQVWARAQARAEVVGTETGLGQQMLAHAQDVLEAVEHGRHEAPDCN